jgi:hypothetical protein
LKWQTNDYDTYRGAKEYIDTALVPLIPIHWGEDMKSIILMGEFTTLISEELERQLKGRMYLFPPFTYLKEETADERLNRLSNLEKQIVQSGMPFVVFLTSDPDWAGQDMALKNSIISIPAVPMEHMEETYKKEIISEQIKHLLKIVTINWQKSD